ncbi:unnamed protein product [Arabis nemorensis]|uniref:Uncharacterized protein n=1 Tax=Arabis nemorensis TaxID=586526 RepID=A0A565BCN1_9BRAS|nr:unnamed protein product [Arabis nemorensis]
MKLKKKLTPTKILCRFHSHSTSLSLSGDASPIPAILPLNHTRLVSLLSFSHSRFWRFRLLSLLNPSTLLLPSPLIGFPIKSLRSSLSTAYVSPADTSFSDIGSEKLYKIILQKVFKEKKGYLSLKYLRPGSYEYEVACLTRKL